MNRKLTEVNWLIKCLEGVTVGTRGSEDGGAFPECLAGSVWL